MLAEAVVKAGFGINLRFPRILKDRLNFQVCLRLALLPFRCQSGSLIGAAQISTVSAQSSSGSTQPSPTSAGPTTGIIRDTLCLIMTLSVAGVGLLSLRRPFTELGALLVGKSDLRSLFCLVVFCIVFLVLGMSLSPLFHRSLTLIAIPFLRSSQSSFAVVSTASFDPAYLTNPSETSFRTYLTEQSFRQHLSRLDDVIDEDHLLEKSANSTSSFRPGATSARHTLPYDNRSPFHFANRASISLKTPKHVFHSFGIFTIAALVPLAKSDRLTQHDSSAISDSWFIGAFGKWWRGGVLEAWYQDVLARPSEEGGWSSGILGMKNMDKYHETNGAAHVYAGCH